MQMNEIILKKILEGNCTETEKKEILAWIKAEDAEQSLQKIFDKYWQKNGGKDFSAELESASLWEKLKDEIAQMYVEQSMNNFSSKEDKKRKVIQFRVLKYAASIAAIFIAAFFLFKNFEEDQPPKLVMAATTITKSTKQGQKLTIKLKDGSTIVLNSNSSVSYPETFDKERRMIKLKGEAFFEVAEDHLRPFSVQAGNTTTTALGTSFDINSYDPDNIKISLATGKVKVSTNVKGTVKDQTLKPGDAITYLSKSQQFKMTEFDYKKDFLWKEGILYFEDAPFNEVIKRLEMWYGVKFETNAGNSSIKSYTGKFDNETLENTLKSMSYSLDFDYSINKKNIKIMFDKN